MSIGQNFSLGWKKIESRYFKTFNQHLTAILKASDTTNEIKNKIFEITEKALAFKVEKDIAAYLKKELDHVYGPTWNVVVGKNFGSFVTHEEGYFVYFYIDDLAFLVFKGS